MAREITLEKAEERAYEVEVISRMLEVHPDKLEESDISAVAGLLARLSGEVVCYFIEESAERRETKKDNNP
ncbi:hypothetical protein ABRP56_09140 [Pectobacterium odoriferum]|uniref:hypothetical protein n=1 Tax=Pectobacterium odoriferum TaxID=78398 RepID=UPI0032EBBEE9